MKNELTSSRKRKKEKNFGLVLAFFMAFFYILDMTSYGSFLLAKNRWLKFKQLALITFLLVEYLYILRYHPSNLALSKMSEILINTQLESIKHQEKDNDIIIIISL